MCILEGFSFADSVSSLPFKIVDSSYFSSFTFFLFLGTCVESPAHVQQSFKGRNTEQLEWMKHLCQ